MTKPNEISTSEESSASRRDALKNAALAAGLTTGPGSTPLFASTADLAQNAVSGEVTCHVLVYGATASGVLASVAAEREGQKIVLLAPAGTLGEWSPADYRLGTGKGRST